MRFRITSLPRFLTIVSGAVLFTASLTPVAHAEKADKFKKTTIDARHTVYDGKTGTKTLSGDVELIRGTLIIRAENAVITEPKKNGKMEDEEEGGSIIMTGQNGSQVFFRQKRDGGNDLWIEGSADRVEYDKKTSVVVFISKAQVRFLDQQKETEKQTGEFISYDSINDVYTVTNSTSGKRAPGNGRVTITLEPKQGKPETKPATKQ